MKKFNDISLTRAKDINEALLKICSNVTAKRAKTVIDHILKYGIITNEDLSELYGYDHPPRAIRDVRENGIPLITHRITSKKTGRKIGAYTFDELSNVKKGRIGGRKAWAKNLKDTLIKKYGSRDAFTQEKLEGRYLQIDHRIPYEVAGNSSTPEDLKEYMLLDASSQRAKSWSCENCENFKRLRRRDICEKCFWAFPENYNHVAMVEERRLSLSWRGEETIQFDKLVIKSKKKRVKLHEMVKKLISDSTE